MTPMTHPHRSPKAFTLVELLVVIAIIGLLLALLMPAMQGAREAGRRTACANNLYQMAFAAIRANDSNGSVPGWRNPLTVGSGTVPYSWPVMILPFMERTDIYNVLTAGTLTDSGTNPRPPFIGFFSCQSSPPDPSTNPVLAYAGNCGSGTGNKNDGVMADNFLAASNRNSMDDISNADGTSMTVLLSEKCGPAYTTQMRWSGTTALAAPFDWNAAEALPVFGITGSPLNPVINPGTVNAVPGWKSQPSSNHPGGAVVSFCDGHTVFLKDSLAYWVYAQLLSSNDAALPTTGVAHAWRTQPGGTAYRVLAEPDFN